VIVEWRCDRHLEVLIIKDVVYTYIYIYIIFPFFIGGLDVRLSGKKDWGWGLRDFLICANHSRSRAKRHFALVAWMVHSFRSPYLSFFQAYTTAKKYFSCKGALFLLLFYILSPFLLSLYFTLLPLFFSLGRKRKERRTERDEGRRPLRFRSWEVRKTWGSRRKENDRKEIEMDVEI